MRYRVMRYRSRLLAELSTGPKRPSDLDEAILGDVYWPGITGMIPPYGDDLGALVREGLVTWWRDDDGCVWYEAKGAG